MENLAIKDFKTRGKEAIEILEMLGGRNKYNLTGNDDCIYYVLEHGEIRFGEYIFGNEPYIFFTLEEFNEKFPFKIFDKVHIPEYESEVKIYSMKWTGNTVEYMVYRCDDKEWYSAEELKEYNEVEELKDNMGFNKEKFMEFVVEEPISMFNPMNMVYSYGCMSNELSVNGINEIDMTDSQRKNVIHKIFMWYRKHPEHLNNLLQYFIEAHYDEYDCSDKPCECCGDVVTTFKLTI